MQIARHAVRAWTRCGHLAAQLANSSYSSSFAPSVELSKRAIGQPANSSSEDSSNKAWRTLQEQGYHLNPCNSAHHPAAKAGICPPASAPLSLQEAYTPTSTCPGCGPAAGEHGLFLRSYRTADGLEARFSFSDKFCCFPGIVAGGAISTALDCHGNWTAAIKLMDSSCLPRPPLTVSYQTIVTYKDTTPPNVPLVIKSKVTSVRRSQHPNAKVTVEVDLELSQMEHGIEKVLVTGHGVYKRTGALRVDV